MSEELTHTLEGQKKILEAALLSSDRPLPPRELAKLFDGQIDEENVRILLNALKADWHNRGVVLTPLADGWRFITNPDYQTHLQKLKNDRPPRYSRATIETMAIIAYRQPLTRGEIEEIRGVAVSTAIIKTLESRGWVEVVGHRNTPGQPALLATTTAFLNDLMLRSLEELPSLQDIEATLEKNQEGSITSLLASAVTDEKNLTAQVAEDSDVAPHLTTDTLPLHNETAEELDEVLPFADGISLPPHKSSTG